ncbi:D-alanyl-D-alanine carboxypeptidase family protein [Rhizobium sp. OAE497]|uniref:D-alanyl-D-alanine carboxypeptidase family protein n=1 Tax=Rhizobium sp. OAE497 TaxID=2663796 RepID=UPI0018F35C68
MNDDINQDDLATARQFLYGRTDKPQSAIDGLRGNFATKLARMMQDPSAPPGLGVYSAYRSPERQAELWAGALKKYGSPEAARKWVAPPGHSQHNEGNAADMGYNGQSLKNAPKEVVDWVHGNAERYGLKFPLANENWHIEDSSTRGGKPSTVAEQALAAGGFQQSQGDYRPVDRPVVSDWIKETPPTSTFQAPVAAPPSWSMIGGAALRSTTAIDLATWSANREAVPDVKWLDNNDLSKFGPTLDGLNPDERQFVIGSAMSPAHASILRQQIDQRKTDAQTFAASPGLTLSASILANLVDPVSMTVGAVAGPAVVSGSNALRAATTAGVLTRMAEAGTIGLVDASVSSGIQAQVDPNFSAEDYAYNALTGMALGAGIGSLARGADLDGVSAEASAAFGRKAREFLADTAARRGYKFATPEARDAFTRAQRSAGAAENVATAAERFPDRRSVTDKLADKLTSVTSNEDLLMNRSGPEVRDLYQQLMPHMTGTGGKELRATEDAWNFMRRTTEVDHGEMEKHFSRNFDGWLKENGMDNAGFWKRDQLEEDFSRQVYYAMSHPDVGHPSQAVADMADAYRGAFAKKLNEAKALEVAWAKDVPVDDHYVPFKVDKRAYYDVTARIGRDGLIDVIKQAFLRAQPELYKAERVKTPRTKGRKLAEEVRDRKVSGLAERYLKMIEDTNIDNNGAERMTGLGGDSARALRDILTEEKVAPDEIEEVISAFGLSQKEGPSNFRRRAVMERDELFIPEKFKHLDNARDYAVSLRQITDQDIRSVYNSYTKSVNGHLALAKAGFRSEADVRARIKEATNFRKHVESGPDGKQNVFEGGMKTAAEALNYYVDKILGRPAFPGVSKKTRLALSLVKNLGFIRFMQQSGISQLGDMPKIALRYGIAATWRQRRMKDLLDVFTYSETEANALTREIQAATGIGLKTKTGKMSALHEDINIGGELFDEDLTTRMLAKANSLAENGARLTSTVSLLNPMTDMLQLWAARASSQKLIDVATGRATMSKKWMNEIGITDRDLGDMRKIAEHMKLDADGKIVRWNSDKQRAVSRDHADAYDRFLAVVRRETHTAILETSPNGIKRSMSGPVAGLFMQLKSYMLNSLLANTAKNIKLGPAYMSMSLVATSIWSAAIYSAQQYSQSIGKPEAERRKFLEDRLSLKGVLAAGFQRSADSSILPMIIDTAIASGDVFTGQDHRLFSNTRNSGLGSSIVDSVPALRMYSDAKSFAINAAAAMARTDQRFDQTEGRQLRDFIPLLRTYGMLNATNALLSTLPPDRDGPVVKSN